MGRALRSSFKYADRTDQCNMDCIGYTYAWRCSCIGGIFLVVYSRKVCDWKIFSLVFQRRSRKVIPLRHWVALGCGLVENNFCAGSDSQVRLLLVLLPLLIFLKRIRQVGKGKQLCWVKGAEFLCRLFTFTNNATCCFALSPCDCATYFQS